jgi:hypothetical protein
MTVEMTDTTAPSTWSPALWLGGSLGCSRRGGRGWAGGGRGAVLQGVSLPGGDHQPLRLALLPVPAELPRGRRNDAGTRDCGQPRDHPAVVCEVRPDLRQQAAPAPSSPGGHLAPRRGVHQNRRQDPLPVAGGGPARERLGHSGHLPAGHQGRDQVFSQAAEGPGVRAPGAGHGQTRQLRRGPAPGAALGRAPSVEVSEQPGAKIRINRPGRGNER